jgi:hypothetical protein
MIATGRKAIPRIFPARRAWRLHFGLGSLSGAFHDAVPGVIALLQKCPVATLGVGVLDIFHQPVEVADFRFDDVMVEALFQIPAGQA